MLEDRSEILGLAPPSMLPNRPSPVPVPQKTMVVGKIDQRVVILFIGGKSIAHSQSL